MICFAAITKIQSRAGEGLFTRCKCGNTVCGILTVVPTAVGGGGIGENSSPMVYQLVTVRDCGAKGLLRMTIPLWHIEGRQSKCA